MSAVKKKVHEPIKSVIISLEECKAAVQFWHHFKIEPVKVPGLLDIIVELEAKGGTITIDDCERVKYLICYEIAYNPHEAFKDELWSAIKVECLEVIALMDEYYPGRVWI